MNAEDFIDSTPGIEHGRYPYAIEGKITNISDDAGLGRVKARIRGQDAADESDWLAPAWPGGIESIPNVGDAVWVLFIGGDPSHGIYLTFPTKNTQSRASEPMVLGLVMAGIVNNLSDQINTLKLLYNAHGHSYSFGTTGPPAAVDTDPTPPKAMDANGSPVSSVTANKIALSGKAKVR